MKFHIEERQADGSFEAKTYELDFSTLTNDDIGALEEQSGWSFAEFNERAARQEMRAMTAQVWLAKRRVDPSAKFGDLVFRLQGLDLEPTTDEIRGTLEAMPLGETRDAYVAALTDEQRVAVEDLLDPIPTEAPAQEA